MLSEGVNTCGPLVMVGLVAGRIVNYVMKDKRVRPLLITEPWDGSGTVNGILFFDGANDIGNHPEPLAIDAGGHEPLCCTPVASVKYCPPQYKPNDNGESFELASSELIPGTWHWPKVRAVRASSVDANVLETVVEQLGAKLREELLGNQDQMIQTVQAKLDANLKAVDDLLDGHHQVLIGLADKAGIPRVEGNTDLGPIQPILIHPLDLGLKLKNDVPEGEVVVFNENGTVTIAGKVYLRTVAVPASPEALASVDGKVGALGESGASQGLSPTLSVGGSAPVVDGESKVAESGS